MCSSDLWTFDLQYGLHDLKQKLPLLIFPLIYSSSDFSKDNKNYPKWLRIFVFSVLAATLLSMLKYFGIFWESPEDPRELSIFHSHIRFGLMIIIAIFTCFYLFQRSITHSRWVWLSISLWLIVFSLILQSLTSISILLFALIMGLLFWPVRKKIKPIKYGISILLGLIIASTIIYIYSISLDMLVPKQSHAESLKKETNYGTKYGHFLDNKTLENGYYININIANKELEEQWNKMSHIKFAEKDLKGQYIKSTIKRFLTSKGLDKDKISLAKLSNQEITAIEKGIPNVNYINISNLELRIRETIWEIGAYFAGNNPGGNTLTQRFEFWRIALAVIKEHPIIGVGTGDVKTEELKMFEKSNSILEKKYRKRAHNQYLTICVALGVTGLIYFVLALIYPLLRFSFKDKPLFFILMIVVLLSFLNEDTLEVQAGITFFAGLYGLFLNNPEDYS